MSGVLHWIGEETVFAWGTHVPMYAPSPVEPGSSVAHFARSLSPDQIMEPSYTGPNHDIGLAEPLLQDTGWHLASGASADGADLQVGLSDSPDPVVVGQPLTYSVTVLNRGPAKATQVNLSDTLPGGAGIVSVTPSQGTCGGAPDIACDLGELEPGVAAEIEIVVTPSVPGQLVNTVHVTANESDPMPGNNQGQASTSVNAPVPPAELSGAWQSVSQRCRLKKGLTSCKLSGSVSVQNTGGQTAPASTVVFYLSGDGVLDVDNDVLLGQASLRSLAVGRGKTAKVKASLRACEKTRNFPALSIESR
jgi:uncharacterized repeat protein (TIGR01451 family)